MVIAEKAIVDKTIINMTGRRQVTIPLRFYERLRFGKEVECVLTDDAILLRPLSDVDDGFTMEILKDLVAQGIQGEELLTKFSEQRQKINRAIGILVNEADEIAAGKRKGATTEDIFGEE